MSVNFTNSHNTTTSNNPEIKKRLEAQENFQAIDKERLKQDAVELANKTSGEVQKQVKENWFYSMLRNSFGVEDPKKLINSLLLTFVTTVSLAFLGNKLSNKTASLGLAVDDFAKNNSIYQGIAKFFKDSKDGIVKFLKNSNTVKDIADTLENRKAKQKLDIMRGYGRGFVSIFSLTPVDILDKVFKKQGFTDLTNSTVHKAGAINIIKKLVGDEKTAENLVDKFISKNKDNREFCELLSDAMRKYLSGNGTTVDNKTFNTALQELQKGNYKGVDSKEITELFTNIDMTGGPVGGWWPVNIVNSIGRKLKLIPADKGFARGNLGNSLVKFNVVDGKLADTAIGKLVQNSITVPTESISNFVNDKSGMGFFLCLMTMVGLYNNVQDAPKEKRAATIADDFIGTIGSIALATPVAFGATYGLASLKNLKGDTLLSKILKGAGQIFGMGLDKYDAAGKLVTVNKSWKNFIPRFAGGALRFLLIMKVFSPIVQKPIRAVIQKVFGKPYDKIEEQKQAQLEQQQNTVIPELGITQKELMEKIQNNQERAEALNNNPELVEKISKNPKLLVDYLDGKDISNIATPEPKIKNTKNMRDITNQMKNNNIEQNPIQNVSQTEEKSNENKNYDTATYVPSSEFVAKDSNLSDEQTAQLNEVMQRADAALKRAEKFI